MQKPRLQLQGTLSHMRLPDKIFSIFLALGISFSSAVVGYFVGHLSMMEEYLRQQYDLDQNKGQIYFTILTALLPLGALISGFFYNSIIKRFGENRILRLLNIWAILCIAIQVATTAMPALIVSRVMMGIYSGLVTGLVPTYIFSFSPAPLIGITGTFSYLAMTFGTALAYHIGQIMDDKNWNKQTAAIVVIAFPTVFIVVSFVMLFLFPFDSIGRLKDRKQTANMKRFMKSIYGPKWNMFRNEIRKYKIVPQSADQEENISFVNRSKKKCQKYANAYIMAIVLTVSYQLSGIGVISEYSKQLFLVIQKGNQTQADNRSLILGYFQTILALLGGFLITRFGRRPITLIGLGVVCLSLLGACLASALVDKHEEITVMFVFFYVLGFSISLGPICFLYAIQSLRSLSVMLAVFWSLATILALLSDIVIERIGTTIMFLFFLVCSISSLFFLYFRMIETKDIARNQVIQLIQMNSANVQIKNNQQKQSIQSVVALGNKDFKQTI